jgi:hypothetical protein
MREVNSCDFCGEAAAGTFEVVPPERDPTGEGRRMVLCESCHDTLGDVLGPLLGADRPGDAGSGEEAADPTTIVAESEREPNTGTDAGTGSGANAESGSPAGGESSEGAENSESIENSGSGGAGNDSAGDTGPEVAAGADLGEALEDGSAGGSPGDRTGGGSAEGANGRPQSARRGAPRGYRNVMRFLESREFPMNREEAEMLATEAYGVDREVVSAAIDHAVKHNRLREANGELLQ